MSDVIEYFEANSLMTTREAAQHLALSPRTLEEWRSLGKGPRVTRIGRAVRYRVADLLAFVDSLPDDEPTNLN